MITIAILSQSNWAFGLIFRGLQKSLNKNSKYNVDFFDWNNIKVKDYFLNYDIVLTSVWDMAEQLKCLYKTKRPILFCGHGLVEFLNRKFTDHTNILLDKSSVEKFNIEPRFYHYLKEYPSFGVVSMELYNKFTLNYNFNNVFYTPCGIDIDLFKPLVKNNLEVLKIVHLHRPYKNINMEHGYDVKRMYLTISIENKLRELGYSTIEFIYPKDGEIIPIEKMPSFYNQGDVYICTSHCEGGPLGPFEAAACGLTVITTDVGEMSSFIEDDINGFLITSKDEDEIVDQFVKHIITLYLDKNKLKDMQDKLYNKVIKERNWDIISQKWELFLDNYISLKLGITYDFIEIGTSDFDTLIQTCSNDSIGLSIEPIKHYLDVLPNKDNVTKINCAISNINGHTNIYNIEPENIIKYNLPYWVRGCNSINNYHPTVLKLLNERGISLDIFNITKVKVIDIKTLIEENNIFSCRKIYIDTEGHDCVILNNYLDYAETRPNLLPIEVKFESNSLYNKEDIDKIITRFFNLGYKLISRNDNTVLRKFRNFSYF